jgi:hypothetical protein
MALSLYVRTKPAGFPGNGTNTKTHGFRREEGRDRQTPNITNQARKRAIRLEMSTTPGAFEASMLQAALAGTRVMSEMLENWGRWCDNHGRPRTPESFAIFAARRASDDSRTENLMRAMSVFSGAFPLIHGRQQQQCPARPPVEYDEFTIVLSDDDDDYMDDEFEELAR